jgi:hypothetical protein
MAPELEKQERWVAAVSLERLFLQTKENRIAFVFMHQLYTIL